MNSLVEFWKRLPEDDKNFIHPDDRKILDESNFLNSTTSFEEFVIAGWPEKSRLKSEFHTKCFPAPYCGDLENAKVILLLLNPGLSYTNYTLENENSPIRRQLKGCLKQDFVDVDFPFHWLNPENCAHGGFNWWESKLRKTLQCVAESSCGGDYFEALKLASKSIAAIELIPYLSKNSPGSKKLEKLPSVCEAKKFVATRSAARPDQKFVILRSETRWCLPARENLVRCSSMGGRSIQLGRHSTAGEEIIAACKSSFY